MLYVCRNMNETEIGLKINSLPWNKNFETSINARLNLKSNSNVIS